MTDRATAEVRVVVDEHTCIGIGACVAAEPDVFDLGDDGIAHVRAGKLLPRERAEEICRGCPSGAIAIAREV